MGDGILPPLGGFGAAVKKQLDAARSGFLRGDGAAMMHAERALAELAAGALLYGHDATAREAARAWGRTVNRRLDKAGC